MDYSDISDARPLEGFTPPLKDFGKNHHDIDAEKMRQDVARLNLSCETRELRVPPKHRVMQAYKSEL